MENVYIPFPKQQKTNGKPMFSPKHLRKIVSDMHHEQRAALQLGVLAMVVLPALIIGTQM